jgi:hypothetical protein
MGERDRKWQVTEVTSSKRTDTPISRIGFAHGLSCSARAFACFFRARSLLRLTLCLLFQTIGHVAALYRPLYVWLPWQQCPTSQSDSPCRFHARLAYCAGEYASVTLLTDSRPIWRDNSSMPEARLVWAKKMRHSHHIHRDDLMRPDLLSEAVIVISVLVVIVSLMFVLAGTIR